MQMGPARHYARSARRTEPREQCQSCLYVVCIVISHRTTLSTQIQPELRRGERMRGGAQPQELSRIAGFIVGHDNAAPPAKFNNSMIVIHFYTIIIANYLITAETTHLFVLVSNFFLITPSDAVRPEKQPVRNKYALPVRDNRVI